MEIKYVGKEKMDFFWGFAICDKEKIFINKDIPKPIQKYVLAHEKYHISDYKRLIREKKRESLIWAEIKAAAYGFFKHPIGTIIAFLFWLKRMPKALSIYFNKKKYKKLSDKIKKELLKNDK